MANEFTAKEVKKIFEQKEEMPKKMALAAAWILANYKGVNIKIFDVSTSSSLCDYNIIATAQNTTQSKTMLDEIQYNLKQNGAKILSVEGTSDADWILLDAGDVIVHIFQELSRDIFNLDELWAGHDQLKIPEEYYFEHKEMEVSKKSDPTDNYF